VWLVSIPLQAKYSSIDSNRMIANPTLINIPSPFLLAFFLIVRGIAAGKCRSGWKRDIREGFEVLVVECCEVCLMRIVFVSLYSLHFVCVSLTATLTVLLLSILSNSISPMPLFSHTTSRAI
jgi:hypothetical protein